jgi:hypothetical protein
MSLAKLVGQEFNEVIRALADVEPYGLVDVAARGRPRPAGGAASKPSAAVPTET